MYKRQVLKYDALLRHQADREVFLSGEAYFKVARNVRKPLPSVPAPRTYKDLGVE